MTVLHFPFWHLLHRPSKAYVKSSGKQKWGYRETTIITATATANATDKATVMVSCAFAFMPDEIANGAPNLRGMSKPKPKFSVPIEQLANRFAIVRNENKWSVHRFQQTNGERNVGLQPARWPKPEHIEHRHDETDHPDDEAADVARFFVTLAHVTNSTRPRMKKPQRL
jgi:hypothetical protein